MQNEGEESANEMMLLNKRNMRKREQAAQKERVIKDDYLTEIPVFPFLPIPSFSSTSLPDNILPAPLPLPLFFATSNTFQNFKSSSLLAVATVVPSGLNAEWRIRA
jgi:hypothetical protein